MSGIAPGVRADRAMYGIGLVLLAYGMFSTVDASVKWLVVFGYPALQLGFMRYIGHFVISTAQVLRSKRMRETLRTQHMMLVVLRGSLILGATVANFIALKYIPLTLTSTIFFSVPIIVCLLSGTMLGESVGKWRWMAILLGFCGILIAIRPFDAGFHWAALLSLAGVTSFAFYLLMTRHLAGVIASSTLQFYAGLVGTVVMLPFAIYYWQWPQTLAQWILLIGLGILAWAGHEILTRAYHYADASVLTPFSYSFMIYLTIWSIVLFDQYPDGWTLVGAGLIVFSGLLIWIRERVRLRGESRT